MKGGNALQLTVAILKPDLVARPRDLQVKSDNIFSSVKYLHAYHYTASGAAYIKGRFLHCQKEVGALETA